MSAKRFRDVWYALEADPIERQRLKMRGAVRDGLQTRIKTWDVTLSAAAK